MLHRPLYYRRDGTPYEGTPDDPHGTLAWGRDFERADRAVARTSLWWGGKVSTVWLGLDHSFGSGPPLIFETMVFGTRSASGLDQDRYPSESAAKVGHTLMVREWSNPLTLLRHLWNIWRNR